MRRALGIAVLVIAAAACTPTTGTTGGGGTKPVISAVSVTPNPVAEGGQVTVTWTIVDSAGVAGTTLLLRDTASGSTATITACANAVQRVSGTAQNGQYSATCNVPATQPTGTYLVDIAAIDNSAGSAEDTSTTFSVTGTNGDDSPPTVVTSSFSLSSGGSGPVVTATVEVSDPSGVGSVAVDLKNEVGGANAGVGVGAKVSGTSTDGTYTVAVPVLSGSPAGTYDVIVVAADQLGNLGQTTIGTVAIG